MVDNLLLQRLAQAPAPCGSCFQLIGAEDQTDPLRERVDHHSAPVVQLNRRERKAEIDSGAQTCTETPNYHRGHTPWTPGVVKWLCISKNAVYFSCSDHFEHLRDRFEKAVNTFSTFR